MTLPKTGRLATALGAVGLLLAWAAPAFAVCGNGAGQIPCGIHAHSATLLETGDVMIAGGITGQVNGVGGAQTTQVELVQTTRGGGIIAGAPMGTARSSHTATNLPSGCVLVVGGANGGAALNTAEIYNPLTNVWTPTGNNLTTGRYNHTSTLLNDGRVLICGGQNNAGSAVAQCEFYTPTSCTGGAFTAGPSLFRARENHTATLLKDGKVWIAGGVATSAPFVADTFLPTTERFDPNTNLFQSASPLIEGRSNHSATLMGDGKVLVVGGYNAIDVVDVLGNHSYGLLQSSEIFDPVGNSISPGDKMAARRSEHAVTLNADGSVSVFGGRGNVTQTTFNPSTQLDTNNFITDTADPKTAATDSLAIYRRHGILSGGTLSIPISTYLGTKVVGKIMNGDILLSTPSVAMNTGIIYFKSGNVNDRTDGLQIHLDGTNVDCDTGGCGHISGDFAMANISSGVYFSTVTTTVSPTLSVSNKERIGLFQDITNGVVQDSIDVSTTELRLTFKIPVDKEFISANVLKGSVRVTDLSIVLPSSFTVTIDEGYFDIPAATPVTYDSVNDIAYIQMTDALLTPITGKIFWAGNEPTYKVRRGYNYQQGTTLCGTLTGPNGPDGLPTYNGGTDNRQFCLPTLGALPTVSMSIKTNYIMDRVNLSGRNFVVDIATIVVREMAFGDFEFYNPTANQWSFNTPATTKRISESASDNRFGHTATLLANNDTIYIGGQDSAHSDKTTALSPLYSVALLSVANTFKTAGSLSQARALHTTTVLPSGKMLVAGGTNGPNVLDTAELIDPTGNGSASPVLGLMSATRDLHTATLLPNGRVLLAGGFSTTGSTGSTKTADIYYPDTNLLMPTSSMNSSRSNHVAILLSSGNVLVAGGFGDNDQITGSAEIFYSTKSTWQTIPSMPAGCERAISAGVLLKDGRVMLIGGVNATAGVLDTSAVWDPSVAGAGAWKCTGMGGAPPAMPSALRSHTATLLFDGRVLVAGGNNGFGETNASYIYDPATNAWTSTDAGGNPLLEPRFNHSATLLPNGEVMISGGSQRFGNVPTSIEFFHVSASSWVTGGQGFVHFAGGARAFHTVSLGNDNVLYAVGGSNGAIGNNGVSLYTSFEKGDFTDTSDEFSKGFPPSVRASTITTATPAFLQGNGTLSITGLQFRGGTEASGGGVASGNSDFSYPHVMLQQIGGSGGAGSQGNSGFVLDLTTEVFQNTGNFSTFNTALTLQLPANVEKLPWGWYAIREGANDIYSTAKMIQVGPATPATAPGSGLGAGIVQGTVLSATSVRWDWNAVGGADGYSLYVATTGVFISTVAGTSYTMSGLNPSATASILVAAFNVSGDGPLGAGATVYTLPNVPTVSAAVGVSITSVTFSSLIFTWNVNGNSSPGTIYEVTMSTDNFATSLSTPAPTTLGLTTNTLTVNGLSANQTYFLRVRAENVGQAFSAYSVVASTKTRAFVNDVGGTAVSSTSISWSWTAQPGATQYNVYNTTTGVLLSAVANPPYVDNALAVNSQRSVMVSVVTSAGEGPLSPAATVYTLAAVPTQLSTSFVSIGSDTFKAQWGPNNNPTGTIYDITLNRMSGGVAVSTVATSTTSNAQPFQALQTPFVTLLPATLYQVVVKGSNGNGIDSAGLVISTFTLPDAPTNVTILGTTPNSLSMSWSTVLNGPLASYQVLYSTDNFVTNVSTAVSFASNFTGSTTTINGLLTSTTYWVKVAAANPYGQQSAYTTPVTTVTFNGGAPAGSIAGVVTLNDDSTITGSLAGGRNVVVRVPAHAFPNDVTVTVSSLNVVGQICPGGVNVAFNIVDQPALQPVGSLFFTFDYVPAELGAIPSNRALLMRFDPASGTCVPLDTTVDTVSHLITARINHFSTFQLAQVPVETTTDDVRVFPNPFYTHRDGFVTIDRAPPGARVRIFTLRGEKVLDQAVNASGLMTWTGTNGAGRSVASGLYLVVVESGGSKRILKLALVR